MSTDLYINESQENNNVVVKDDDDDNSLESNMYVLLYMFKQNFEFEKGSRDYNKK